MAEGSTLLGAATFEKSALPDFCNRAIALSSASSSVDFWQVPSEASCLHAQFDQTKWKPNTFCLQLEL
jgi:hypothetical protein